jgi:hypothetical protein
MKRTEIVRHARTALLSLLGPVDASDIEAAKHHLRLIIDSLAFPNEVTALETQVDSLHSNVDAIDPTITIDEPAELPSARYNKGIGEYAPDKQPRLPSCPHYMSGWNEAKRDYAAEMRSEQRP